MSSENEGQLSLRSPMGSSASVSDQKKPRIKYTRDFFLSLSELDICKKLPSGLDKSILSDLEEATSVESERQRSFFNLSFQCLKRGEYGSQLLNRPENSNSSKGISSRWIAQSSGSSDREVDLQSDRESFTQDSGRRFGNQNRRTWQDPEHDGLLGSGALARPPGFTGASAPKARGNGQHQLSRNTEPYQPPRTYKAAPYSRKDGSDLRNDETFGSIECSNVDRAEDERKRRESFDLMRKEQLKTLQDKNNNDSHKGNLDVDIMVQLDNSDADKSTKSRSKQDESAADSLSPCDSSKSSSLIHVPAARPLVPPGFASTLMEKNNQINKLKGMALHSDEGNESPSAPSSVVPDVGFGNISFNTSVLQEANEVWIEDMPNDSFHKKEAEPDRADAPIQDHSTSIFDKLFGNALVKNSDSLASDIQNHVNQADDEAWAHVTSESSKFAHLFHVENEGQLIEKMAIEDRSSRDLLSLIVNNDNFGSQVYLSSNVETTEKNQSSLPSENAAVLPSSPAPSPITGMFLESYQGDEQRPCAVLTCEDLEQSILAEVKDRCSVIQSLQEPLTAVDDKSEELKGVVDDHASHHLLSLLHRGANSKELLESPRLDVIGSHDMLASSDVESSLHFQLTHNAAISLSETHSSEKRLTLEALFGAAFMNELHSMEAPVSAQKNSVGRVNDSGAIQSYGLTFHPPDSFNSTLNEQHSKKVVFEGEMLQLNNSAEHTRVHKNTENWAGCRDSSLLGFKLGDLAFEQAAGDIHLPEEDSLISLNDSLDTVASDSLCFQNVNRNESLVPEKMVGDNDKLLHAILRVGGPSKEEPAVDYPALMQTSHEMANPGGDYHHLLVRPTLQFPHQINHGFASHSDHSTLRNSQINFLSPDVLHHDSHHPFAQNVFAHHSYNTSSVPHFDPTLRHQMLQPMPFPGNFSSHNSVQGFPRVPHPINHIPGFSHDMNNLHMLPQHHRQLNHGGRGMGMPGNGSGGAAAGRRSQEAFDRLMEMEMRANAKQFHPSLAEHVPGMHGAELDMNLRYM